MYFYVVVSIPLQKDDINVSDEQVRKIDEINNMQLKTEHAFKMKVTKMQGMLQICYDLSLYSVCQFSL